MQAVGSLQRPGQPIESLELMSFFIALPSDPMTVGRIARALGAQLSYLLDRRMDVLAEVSIHMEESDRLTFIPMSGLPDRALLAPIDAEYSEVDQLLRDHLSVLCGLDEADYNVLNSALDMHHGACLLLDRDIASAYTLVVAGIEALSRRFGEPPTDWSDWDLSDVWDRFSVSEGLDTRQADALRAALMNDRQLRLNETFSTYASERLPASFWEGRWRDWVPDVTMPEGTLTGGHWEHETSVADLVPPDRQELKRALRRSYQARSGFVHTGDRAVNLSSEFFARAAHHAIGHLTFPALRLVLRALIAEELKARVEQRREVPPLVYSFGAEEL
jgi:hypothetical protein